MRISDWSSDVCSSDLAGPTVGVALLLWGVFTLYMWIGTFRLPKILFLIFLTLWVTFLLLGLGAAMGAGGLTRAGGMLGILCGGLAMYGSFGIVTKMGRAHVWTPVTNAHLVCRLLVEKKKKQTIKK